MEPWIPALSTGTYRNWGLFNLETDSGRQANLADAQPAVFARLIAQMLAIDASVMADGTDWSLSE